VPATIEGALHRWEPTSQPLISLSHPMLSCNSFPHPTRLLCAPSRRSTEPLHHCSSSLIVGPNCVAPPLNDATVRFPSASSFSRSSHGEETCHVAPAHASSGELGRHAAARSMMDRWTASAIQST
jgi:hypothetical protein